MRILEHKSHREQLRELGGSEKDLIALYSHLEGCCAKEFSSFFFQAIAIG